ncbi:MAG: hypothetical protein Q8O34_07770 [Rhodocyclaceae bacterium]|nr:hypothetical protein [Rhodocyclaceae bacterium]
MNEKIEFDCGRTDEQLIACSSLPIHDRLQWMDEVRRFTLMVREAPTVNPESSRRRPEGSAEQAPRRRWRRPEGSAAQGDSRGQRNESEADPK